MREVDAYIAGVMDSEGSFVLSFDKRYRGNVNYLLSIANTDMNMLMFIKQHFGGHIAAEAPRENKQCYKWYPHAARVMEFLDRVTPYLIAKKDQAVLMKQYLESRTDKQTDEDKANRLEMRRKMQVLNGKKFASGASQSLV